MRKRLVGALLALTMVFLTAGCGKEEGSVYYLNFKPEADEAWQELARIYTEQTGVKVRVVTAASGTYSETLTTEMSKSSAPTLFQCANQAELDVWDDYCLDLRGTDFYKELTTEEFVLWGDEGEALAVGYCYEAFGLITNVKLLETAGYSPEDITDFASLKRVAEDIAARSEELGFTAFTSAGLDSSSSWRFSGHLANMPLYYEFRDRQITSQPASITGEYLEYYKNIWDLYIQNATCAPGELAAKTVDQAEAEFAGGKAVFFQNGSWEYTRLVEELGMSPEDLAMIPIYIGVPGEGNSGLACGTENCWAVNEEASEESIKATLNFMYWVVTSPEGTAMMAQEFGAIPFRNSASSENVFLADAEEMIAQGRYVVPWVFGYTPNTVSWRAALVSALLQYSAGNGSWENVETAFVDGWSTQYAAEHH